MTTSTLIRQYHTYFHIQKLYLIVQLNNQDICSLEMQQGSLRCVVKRCLLLLLRMGVQSCSQCNCSSEKVIVMLVWLHV